MTTPDVHATTPGVFLTLNAGSSSLKFAVFKPDGGALSAVVRGEVSRLATHPRLIARGENGLVLADRTWPADASPPFDAVLQALLGIVEDGHGDSRRNLAAVGHRIVHGGSDHVGPAIVTPALMADLRALTPLDPLHLPHNLAPIDAIARSHPRIRQVVSFDTAFHATLPRVARQTGLPLAFEADGLRRYGFHGLSYEYIAARLRTVAPALGRGRVVVAHLGSGASLCALHDGRSVATTMGFSALDGLLMATRCGSLDPGIILYLARTGHDLREIEDMLYFRSGLLGVSGISGDIRDLLASDDPRAAAAIDLFSYRIALETAAMVCALGGVDGLVFTAGIGEHAPAVRAAVCARLGWLGVRLDPAANAAAAAIIAAADSRVDVRVIATDEEATIARHTRHAIERGAPERATMPESRERP